MEREGKLIDVAVRQAYIYTFD